VYRDARDFMQGTSGWHYCNQGNLWFDCGCGAMLMLTRGRYDWFSPSLLLSPTAAEVFKALNQRDGLPHIPSTVMELQRVLRDDKASGAQLAAAVKSAPFIAVEILRMANARRSTGDKPMTSLDHAIVFVGRQAVADLARAASLRSFRFRTKAFNTDDFWREALVTAKIAEHVVKARAPEISPDEAYIAGFLCNIGKVVAAIAYPEATDRVYEMMTRSKTLPHWRAAETAAPGAFDHCVLGEIGAVLWGMPAFVRDAAAKHHAPVRPRARGSLTPTDAATFANQLAHWVLLNPNRIDEQLLHGTGANFGYDEPALEKLAEELIELNKAAEQRANDTDDWLKQMSISG
jgi:HD-like signal output (HDOD) protein